MVGSIIEGLTIYITSEVIYLNWKGVISKLLMNGLARQGGGQF